MSEKTGIQEAKQKSSVGHSARTAEEVGPSPAAPSSAGMATFLQRTIGNQAVQRLFKAGLLQPKLKIGSPNDAYEQEADRVEDQVMSMPETPAFSRERSALGRESGPVQRKPGCPHSGCSGEAEEELVRAKPVAEQITPLVQREEEEREDDENKTILAKAWPDRAQDASPDVESAIESLRGSGRPLPESTRSFFEPRFGRDFGAVRIHDDDRAARSAQSINARAFTTGRDIVFGPGQFAPTTADGQRLLAHELTHVVQQSAPTAAGREGINKIQRRNYLDDPIENNRTLLISELKDLLQEWLEAAHNGASRFANYMIVKKMTDVDEKDWGKFLLTCVGNTVWALSAFAPTGWPQFAVSMMGIAIQTIPQIPSKKESDEEAIEKLFSSYINDVYGQLKNKLEETADAYYQDNKNKSLREGIIDFLTGNFNTGMYKTKGSPGIDLDAVEQRMVDRGKGALSQMAVLSKSKEGVISFGAEMSKLSTIAKWDVLKEVEKNKFQILSEQLKQPDNGVLVVILLGGQSHHNDVYITYKKLNYLYGFKNRWEAVSFFSSSHPALAVDYYWIPPMGS